MAKAKCIPLFEDQLETVEFMSDAELGAAVRGAMRYMHHGEDCTLSGCAGMMYAMLKAQFIRDQADAASGKKGGRPPKHKNPVSNEKTPLSKPETNRPDQTLPDSTLPDSTLPDSTGPDRPAADKPQPRACFIPPSLEELRAYCQERRNHVDPEKFLSYYESNGWRVGKNPMKSWKAAVRTWESNGLEPDKPPAYNYANLEGSL